MKRINSQKGQALVLIALAAVALFGFTALAIDGSRVFSDKRHAQNAADSAVLAAALKSIRTQGNAAAKFAAAVTAAQNLASTNGYNNNGTTNTVQVNLCSDSGVTCEGLPAGATASEYIRVKISSTIPSTFARVIRRNSFTNTAEAIARAAGSSSTSSSGGSSYGITTLKTTCGGSGNETLKFTGSGNVNIQGGIGDNSCFASTGSGNFNVTGDVQVSSTFAHTGSGDWTVGGNVWVNGFTKTGSQNWNITGGFFSDGTFSQTGSGDLTAGSFTTVGSASNVGSGQVNGSSSNPPPHTVGTYQTPPTISDPYATVLNPPANPGSCTAVSNTGSTSHTIDPGCYTSISQTGSGNLTLNPGIYYITGNFSMTGSGDLTANGVLIYMQGGSMSMTGSGSLHVSPMTSGTYKGLSIYMDRANTNSIRITGSGSSSFSGTVYAPASAYTATGSGGTFVLDSQVLCSSAELTGSGALNLTYNPANNYNPAPPDSPTIELVK